ncbi:exo-beta-N-acetylmuramidase NamZ family protein [Altibacter sp. HG106]|uniref:exo-beta-N-acetylmuramidase NamZ family protein n=1 Tax=Altibacter sp. HG106 TaxID=3023937 RepID=UPI00235046CA|nr:DUF1343 domain-containing protein [Altibacter sp. HG106]MDC7996117.1 DUF1343 domain-containing protein [Altibacter sp. HG106]
MHVTSLKNTLLILVLGICFSCGSQNKEASENSQDPENASEIPSETSESTQQLILGADQPEAYLPLLRGKAVALVANPTSQKTVATEPNGKGIHLVDFFLSKDIALKTVFAPEHGFRGTADAGEHVKDGIDTKTGLPIFSLHGKNKKPTPDQLNGIDIVVFDIQDVGVRFYTYISTLHYVMEACAEANIPVVVLDRPNPNGHYVDGPMMEPQHTNFLGMHPVPLVHGMTIGEYATMINGEGWLANNNKVNLTVIAMEGYTHDKVYSLPIKPSPNLPNDTAITLYPSLGLLEGTTVNAGRGTDMQFQVFGAPELPKAQYPFEYTPQPNEGAKYPKQQGKKCHGIDLRNTERMNRVDLSWIIEAYRSHAAPKSFFNTKNFTAHAGTELLQKQIEDGLTFREIRKTWLKDLEAFKKVRERYLLYP